MLEKLFHAWERRLAFRDDSERRVLPFDWGASFLGDGNLPSASAKDFVLQHARHSLDASDAYFRPVPVSAHRFQAGRLQFTSPLLTPHEENNTVHGELFGVEGKRPDAGRRAAVIVLPQWNAQPEAQRGLCRLLNLFGMTALKLTLPYHGPRMPSGLARADHILSPNVGQTLYACRQAVQETLAVVSWLEDLGYGPIGIIGTSLGSCIAFIAFAHDERIRSGVFNHISPYFADVVWKGLSTRHVREGLEGSIDLDVLRKAWLPISPQSYVERLCGGDRASLLITARYDLSFPPDLSEILVEEFERLGAPYERFILPCGHYTTALFPFNYLDGFVMARFLRRQLG
jgi:hypothetical protein